MRTYIVGDVLNNGRIVTQKRVDYWNRLQNDIDKILNKISVGEKDIPENICWLFTGSLDKDGYGQVAFKGRMKRIHHITYEHFKGSIPQGLQLDHLCRVRNCCNPNHLEAVTVQENIRRSDGVQVINAAKIYCIKGHRFTPENTYVYRGHRCCRMCHTLRERVRRAQLEGGT